MTDILYNLPYTSGKKEKGCPEIQLSGKRWAYCSVSSCKDYAIAAKFISCGCKLALLRIVTVAMLP